MYRPSQYDSAEQRPRRPVVQEDFVKTTELQVERKHFALALKENPRGRFLRITEDVGGRFNSIIIPSSGLADFHKAIGEMLKADQETPAKQPVPDRSQTLD